MLYSTIVVTPPASVSLARRPREGASFFCLGVPPFVSPVWGYGVGPGHFPLTLTLSHGGERVEGSVAHPLRVLLRFALFPLTLALSHGGERGLLGCADFVGTR